MVFDSSPEGPATFERVQTTVFDVSCASSGCHGGSAWPDLSAGTAYGNIVRRGEHPGSRLGPPEAARTAATCISSCYRMPRSPVGGCLSGGRTWMPPPSRSCAPGSRGEPRGTEAGPAALPKEEPHARAPRLPDLPSSRGRGGRVARGQEGTGEPGQVHLECGLLQLLRGDRSDRRFHLLGRGLPLCGEQPAPLRGGPGGLRQRPRQAGPRHARGPRHGRVAQGGVRRGRSPGTPPSIRRSPPIASRPGAPCPCTGSNGRSECPASSWCRGSAPKSRPPSP